MKNEKNSKRDIFIIPIILASQRYLSKLCRWKECDITPPVG